MEEQESNEPLANYDPWVEGGGVHGFMGKPIARYDIIFDDEPQLKAWYAFIRRIKSTYPKERTIGGRVSRFLEDWVNANPLPKESIEEPKKRVVKKTKQVTEPTPEPSEPAVTDEQI